MVYSSYPFLSNVYMAHFIKYIIRADYKVVILYGPSTRMIQTNSTKYLYALYLTVNWFGLCVYKSKWKTCKNYWLNQSGCTRIRKKAYKANKD